MAKLDQLSKTLIVIVGPTAVGKTSLSIELATRYRCPIISTDSRQFYREMTIGTAKPSQKELAQVKHHFINSRSVQDFYTAGMFEKDAIAKLDKIFSKNNTCVAVGGSGLYINALCYGIDDIPSDIKVRDKLVRRWKKEGLVELQKELLAIDPDFYHQSDMKNSRRVIRALEVFEISGNPLSSYHNKMKKERPFNILWVGLEEELPSLYDRINERVDKMVEDGLLEEVRGLFSNKSLKALNSVGYIEFFDHLEGNISLETAIELVKKNSRKFAKRQFTWFRKNQEIKWFSRDNYEKIFDHIILNKQE